MAAAEALDDRYRLAQIVVEFRRVRDGMLADPIGCHVDLLGGWGDAGSHESSRRLCPPVDFASLLRFDPDRLARGLAQHAVGEVDLGQGAAVLPHERDSK
jgi:hypothetical protein